ncbi:MAG: universal stress protein [Chloroflexi bacterium]|nr:universal stress protein [Chloroflexota bacterium]
MTITVPTETRAVARARIGPVVLGTDLGPASTTAETDAIAAAHDGAVPLVVVHAIDPGRLRLPGDRFPQRFDQVRTTREGLVARLVERARAVGVDARVLIWDGDPATCIVDAARAENASRIVIGTHGRGLLVRVISGSVSAAVVATADCPVDIVPTRTVGDPPTDTTACD